MESFDSRDLLGSYGNTLRPTVAKSYSFGGYTATCASEANVATMRTADENVAAPFVYQQPILGHQSGHGYGSRFLSKQVRSSEVGSALMNHLPCSFDVNQNAYLLLSGFKCKFHKYFTL